MFQMIFIIKPSTLDSVWIFHTICCFKRALANRHFGTSRLQLNNISDFKIHNCKGFLPYQLLLRWVMCKKKVWSCSLIHIEVLTKPWYK